MHAQDYLIQTSEDNPLNVLQYESEWNPTQSMLFKNIISIGFLHTFVMII
jgi:hypothetical protein